MTSKKQKVAHIQPQSMLRNKMSYQARFAINNLTQYNTHENLVSDSRLIEDEFGAEPSKNCGDFVATKGCRHV